MTKVLVFDISSNTGVALLEGERNSLPKIVGTETISNSKTIAEYAPGTYPWTFIHAAEDIAQRLVDKVLEIQPDVVVIEETNKPGRFGNRYSQKFLEFTHCTFLRLFEREYEKANLTCGVAYVNTSDWRKMVGAHLTKADKALNVKVRKLKKAGDKEGLKKLGVRGKIGKKHVALRYVNQTFNLNLKMKDNDIADAICQGVAYFLGVKTCDGK